MWDLHSAQGWSYHRNGGAAFQSSFSVKYDDITEQRLDEALVQGSHATVTINDSVMWQENPMTLSLCPAI